MKAFLWKTPDFLQNCISRHQCCFLQCILHWDFHFCPYKGENKLTHMIRARWASQEAPLNNQNVEFRAWSLHDSVGWGARVGCTRVVPTLYQAQSAWEPCARNSNHAKDAKHILRGAKNIRFRDAFFVRALNFHYCTLRVIQSWDLRLETWEGATLRLVAWP